MMWGDGYVGRSGGELGWGDEVDRWVRGEMG